MSEKIYRIGEAAALLELKDYVLRFWETEFPQLVPVRTGKGSVFIPKKISRCCGALNICCMSRA